MVLRLNSIPLEGLTKRNVPAAPEIIPLKGTHTTLLYTSCTPHIDTHGIAAHNVSPLSSQLLQ